MAKKKAKNKSNPRTVNKKYLLFGGVVLAVGVALFVIFGYGTKSPRII